MKSNFQALKVVDKRLEHTRLMPKDELVGFALFKLINHCVAVISNEEDFVSYLDELSFSNNFHCLYL